MARSKRQDISPALRFEVLTRCNFACYYCGTLASLGAVQLHIEHVIPVALGGTNDPWNLVAACQPCNTGKAAAPPPADLIERVRCDYCGFLSANRGSQVDQCQFCFAPILLEVDEVATGQCERCCDLRCDAWEVGYDTALKTMTGAP